MSYIWLAAGIRVVSLPLRWRVGLLSPREFSTFPPVLAWRGASKGVRWTAHEDELVIKMREKGFTIPEISDRLGDRSLVATSSRIHKVLVRNGTLKPRIKKGKFSKEEDDLLEDLRNQGLSFTAMSSHFVNRSAGTLESRFRTLNIPDQTESAGFTPADDAELCKLREQDRLTWNEVAARLPGRDALACSTRYALITPLAARVNVKPLRYRVDEKYQEVRRLRDQGHTWRAIVEAVPGINSDTAAARAYHAVRDLGDMILTLKRNRRYTPQEDDVLSRLKAARVTAVDAAKVLPGRSADSIAKRWQRLRERSEQREG